MYYPMNYQQQPTFQPFPQLMQNQRTDVVRVNGRNGAEAYAMGANSSALLLDESGTLVWLVTTDGAGYKTIAPYDITPHKAAEAPDFASLEARITKIEEVLKNGNSGDSTSSKQKRNQPAVVAD